MPTEQGIQYDIGDLITLSEASEICDYSQDYLSLLARKGRLRAVKHKHQWHTTRQWLQKYIDSVRHTPAGKKEHTIEPKDAPLNPRRSAGARLFKGGALAAIALVVAVALGTVVASPGAGTDGSIRPWMSDKPSAVGRFLVPESLRSHISSGFKTTTGTLATLADRTTETIRPVLAPLATTFYDAVRPIAAPATHTIRPIASPLTDAFHSAVRTTQRVVVDPLRSLQRSVVSRYLVPLLRDSGVLVRDDITPDDDLRMPSQSEEPPDFSDDISDDSREQTTRTIVRREVEVVERSTTLGPTALAELSSFRSRLNRQETQLAELRAQLQNTTVTKTVREEVVVDKVRREIVERENRIIRNVISPGLKISTLGDQDDIVFTFKDPEGFDFQQGNVTFSTDGSINQTGGGDVTFSGVLAATNGVNVTGDTDITGRLDVGGNASFAGSVDISGALSVGDSATSSGQFVITDTPTTPHTFSVWSPGTANSAVSDASLYINPASADPDTNLIGAAVSGSPVFLVDAEGDTFVNNLTASGSVTQGTTTIASLTVEGSTTLGDASGDTITTNARFASDLLPSADDTYDIGSGSLRWRDLYLSQQASVAGDLNLGGALTASNAASHSLAGDLEIGDDASVGRVRINPDSDGEGIDLFGVFNSRGTAINFKDQNGIITSRIYTNTDNTDLFVETGSNQELGMVFHSNNGRFTVSSINEEFLRVTNSGNVGIGTTDVSDAMLEVAGGASLSGDVAIQGAFTASNAASHSLAGDLEVSDDASVGNVFHVTEGNVGIGTADPTVLLDARGNIGISSGSRFYFDVDDGVQDHFFTQSTNVLSYTAQGNVVFRLRSTIAEFIDVPLTMSQGQKIGLDSTQDSYVNAPTGDSLALGTNALERVRIDDSGNVGIGTTDVSDAKLEVAGNASISGTLTTGGALTVSSGASFSGNVDPATDDTYTLGEDALRWADLFLGPSTLHIGTSTTDEGTFTYNTTSNDLEFATTGGDFFFDTANGNMGIGATGPSSALEVSGSIETAGLLDNDGTNLFDGACGDNQHITGISSNGAISCGTDSGDISAVTAGNQLTGGGTSGSITLDVNEGSGSGLDADTVDGLSSGSFIRSDANDNVAGNTEWQDGFEVRFGNSADWRLDWVDGGPYLRLRGYRHGSQIRIQGENASGTNKAMIYADPDNWVRLYYSGGLKAETHSNGLNIPSTSTNHGLQIDGVRALTGDTVNGWLRLNRGAGFSNGVYTSGLIRADGGFQVDAITVIDSAGGIVGDQIIDGSVDGSEIGDGSIGNVDLANSSLTVTAGNQLTGGGTVSLGSSITLDVSEGSGSGLDADLLDNLNSSQFLRSDTSDTFTGAYLGIGSDGGADNNELVQIQERAVLGSDLVRLENTDGTNGCGCILVMFKGANARRFRFENGGNAYADGSWNGGGADVAETFIVVDEVEPGDFVETTSSDDSSSAGRVLQKHTGEPYSDNVVGVVSTFPGLRAGLGDVDPGETIDERSEDIALVGRVPVKVSLENGIIREGDPITASSLAGVGMKAEEPGRIIGWALEPYDGSQQISPGVQFVEDEWSKYKLESEPMPPTPSPGVGKIMVFVNVGYWDGDVLGPKGAIVVDDSSSQTITLSNGNVGIGGINPNDAKLEVSGNASFSGTCTSEGADCATDVAEVYATAEPLEAGDVVALERDAVKTVKRARTHNDPPSPKATDGQSNDDNDDRDVLVGVVSTAPGLVLEGEATRGRVSLGGGDAHITDTTAPIALVGRVPVKVNTENGPIATGDPLTASSTPGVAMKATEAGQIIGFALEPYDATDGNDRIIAFLDVQYWVPAVDGAFAVMGGPTTDTTSPDGDSFSVSSLVSALKDAVVHVKTLVAERVEATVGIFDTLRARRVVSDAFEVRDKVTGDLYCVQIAEGEWVKDPGACDEGSQSDESADGSQGDGATLEVSDDASVSADTEADVDGQESNVNSDLEADSPSSLQAALAEEGLAGVCPALSRPVCGADGVSYRNSCLALQSGTTPSSSGICDGEPLQEGALWSEGYKDTNEVEESGAQGAERVHEETAEGTESTLDEPLTTSTDPSTSPSTSEDTLEPAPTASASVTQ